jgi:hypothetical protein
MRWHRDFIGRRNKLLDRRFDAARAYANAIEVPVVRTLISVGSISSNEQSDATRLHTSAMEKKIIKIMVLLHSADGVNWQSPPKGTSLKTLSEAEEQGFILIRGEFQKRQFRLTELGFEYAERDKRRLEARKL